MPVFKNFVWVFSHYLVYWPICQLTVHLSRSCQIFKHNFIIYGRYLNLCMLHSAGSHMPHQWLFCFGGPKLFEDVSHDHQSHVPGGGSLPYPWRKQFTKMQKIPQVSRREHILFSPDTHDKSWPIDISK